MSRASLGVTALLAIGFLGVAAAVPQRRRAAMCLQQFELTRKDAVGLGASCVLAIIPYAYVNWARFGTPLSVPLSKQPVLASNPQVVPALKQSGGTLFSVRYIPTTIVQYFRPDAIGLHWPWPTFAAKASPLFGARLAASGPATSVVDSMLAFTALSVVGVVWLVRKSACGPDKHIVVIPLAAGVAGSFATLSFGWLTHRYVTDFMPMIVLSSLIGMNATIQWLRSSKPTPRKIASAGLVALVGLNVWASIGLARVSAQSRRRDEKCLVVSLVYCPHTAGEQLAKRELQTSGS
jgi:hypothetical protein